MGRTDDLYLHRLPVRRNVVVSDEVIDGPRHRDRPGGKRRTQKALLLEQLELTHEELRPVRDVSILIQALPYIRQFRARCSS